MLSRDEWFAVVRSAPLVSIDLIVRDRRGRILLGWRRNEPARDCWFVPGGAIRKNETLDQAFERIALTELGQALSRTAAQLRGVYEHFYSTNFAGAPNVGTHYVVLAHELRLDGDITPADAQHERFAWFEPATALADPLVHGNSKAYLRNN